MKNEWEMWFETKNNVLKCQFLVHLVLSRSAYRNCVEISFLTQIQFKGNPINSKHRIQVPTNVPDQLLQSPLKSTYQISNSNQINFEAINNGGFGNFLAQFQITSNKQINHLFKLVVVSIHKQISQNISKTSIQF